MIIYKDLILTNDKITISFLSKNNKKYLILKNLNNEVKLYLTIPNFITISKKKSLLRIKYLDWNDKIEVFFKLLKSILSSVIIPFKKTLILKGLGLKVTESNNKLVLKLGFSHLLQLPIKKNVKVLIGKNYLSVLGHNKAIIGNIIMNLYCLKKMDCYKGRGFFFKNKLFFFKPIKKA